MEVTTKAAMASAAEARSPSPARLREVVRACSRCQLWRQSLLLLSAWCELVMRRRAACLLMRSTTQDTTTPGSVVRFHMCLLASVLFLPWLYYKRAGSLKPRLPCSWRCIKFVMRRRSHEVAHRSRDVITQYISGLSEYGLANGAHLYIIF